MTTTGRRSPWAVFFVAFTLVLLFIPPSISMAAGEEEIPMLDFFDSGSFDRKLSGELKKDPAKVMVKFPAPATVNKIPERMDKWFSQVEHYGGTVELKEEESTRGILGVIIDLLIGAYRLTKEKMTYGPVEDYNAEIWYETADGAITKVLFVRKAEAQ
jgi:hypothetical protein